MKKLYILLIAFVTFMTLPGLQTQAYSLDANDIAITELNGLTLNDIFLNGNIVDNGTFENLNGWILSSNLTESIDNDRLKLIVNNVVPGDMFIRETHVPTIGNLYYSSFNIETQTTNTITFGIRFGANNDISFPNLTNKFESFSFTATDTVNQLRLSFYNFITVGDIVFIDNFYLIDLTLLGINTVTISRIDYWFYQWQINNAYIQGELDGYASGLEDNTAYVQGYNVGYSDGLLEGVDMETGSSIIVLVLAALSFAFMLFGFTSKRRIFNLFASGLFIALGAILFEYPAFIIVTIGLVIVNVYYTFVSD